MAPSRKYDSKNFVSNNKRMLAAALILIIAKNIAGGPDKIKEGVNRCQRLVSR